MTTDVLVQAASLPATTKVQPTKTDDVAPEDGVSQASGGSKGAKRQNKHAERAKEVHILADRLTVFEDAFAKATRVPAKKKTSGYASKDDTRPSRSPDSELRGVINVVQQGL